MGPRLRGGLPLLTRGTGFCPCARRFLRRFPKGNAGIKR